EGGGAAALGHQALTLLFHLARLLAVLAANRERQGAQPALADFLAALEAVAVGALFQPPKRFVDLIERFRLHLNQGELDFVLDVGLGALGGVEHALDGASGALRADVPHALLDFAHDFAAALLENILQLGVASTIHLFPGSVMTVHMSATPFVRPLSLPLSKLGALCNEFASYGALQFSAFRRLRQHWLP